MSAAQPQASAPHVSGFTLVEVLVALTIFTGILVPLLGAISRAAQVSAAQKRLVAMCLLDQESALVRAAPAQMVALRRRQVQGQEWLIRAQSSGTGLVWYRLKAENGGRQYGEARLAVYAAPGRQRP